MFAMNAFAKTKADEIFRTGPETLAVRTSVIIAGPATRLRIDVERAMEGETATPLVWITHGVIESGRKLKGTGPQQAIEFARRETSPFAVDERPDPYWLADYGNLVEGGEAVAFLSSAEPPEVALVVPSGSEEQDLEALVIQATRIAELEGGASRRAAQIDWLHSATTDAERRAALRGLVRGRVPWDVLSAELRKLWTGLDPTMREFVVGLTGFAIKEGIWPKDDVRPVHLICSMFLQEQNPERQPIAMLPLKMLLVWADEEEEREARAGIRNAVVECLRRRRAAGGLSEQLQQLYEQIDPKFRVL
jgi:hypothetical protein